MVDARLDAETCKRKAAECRLFAQQDQDPANRALLLHIAETWDRIGKTYENGPAEVGKVSDPAQMSNWTVSTTTKK